MTAAAAASTQPTAPLTADDPTPSVIGQLCYHAISSL